MKHAPRISFEEDSLVATKRRFGQRESKLTTGLITLSRGLIKDTNQANIVLLVFVVLCFGIATVIIVSGTGSDEYPEELQIIPAV